MPTYTGKYIIFKIGSNLSLSACIQMKAITGQRPAKKYDNLYKINVTRAQSKCIFIKATHIIR
jgi:hypothetical protein